MGGGPSECCCTGYIRKMEGTRWESKQNFARACYISIHARGELHCDSHPQHSIAFMDLLFLVWEEDSWYVFNCSFMRNLFLAMHCMLLWQIYKGQRWARKIWIFYWICFQIRRMLSRGIHLALALPFPHLSFS